jgi:hypothetical protein
MAEYKQIRPPKELIGEKVVSMYSESWVLVLVTESGKVLRIEPQASYEESVVLKYEKECCPYELQEAGVISKEEEAAMYVQIEKERASFMRQQELKQLRDLEKKYGDVRT